MRSSPAQHDLMGVKKRTTLPTEIAGNALNNIYEKTETITDLRSLCSLRGSNPRPQH